MVDGGLAVAEAKFFGGRMRVLVLLNVKAGSVDGSREQAHCLREEFLAASVACEVRAVLGRQLAETAAAAVEEAYDVIVAAGGDGTVSSVAAALAGTDKPLGILPMGTLNHFAKDLGIPVDLPSAVRLIASGQIRQVDLAEVNERIFINNSSIGIYPQMVRNREHHQQRWGCGKWPAMMVAIVTAIWRFPRLKVRLGVDQRTMMRATPFVFVGNSVYEMNLLAVRGRSCLDRGELSVYLAHYSGRLGMLRLALRAWFGKLKQAREFEWMCVPEVQIESRRRRLYVALDGEVTAMSPPLRYRTMPLALRVCAPPAAAAEGQ